MKTEDDPVIERRAGASSAARSTATLELERQVLGADGLEGLVLRYGVLLRPGDARTPPTATRPREVRRRRFPIVGDGAGIFSFVHVDDAAAATVAACERGAPGIYNVCDDEPAPVREWLPVYAEALGAKPPRRVPTLARAAGRREPAVIAFATTLRGASNAQGEGASSAGSHAIRAGARAFARRSDKF